MDLAVAHGEPGAAHAWDLRPFGHLEAEQVTVEGAGLRQPAGNVDAGVQDAAGLHPRSSMNSSLRPGASRKAMRRRPKCPSTTSGPQDGSMPAKEVPRSSTNRAAWRKPGGRGRAGSS